MELIGAKAWIKRNSGRDEILRLQMESKGKVIAYLLFPAYEPNESDLGRILFDDEGNWIYDGNDLTIAEQEQIARFILKHT
jgi:hypothetical protein